VPPKFIYLLQQANLIGPSLITNKKLWRFPKIKGFILKYRNPFLWFIYIVESMITFAKAYGIKVRCYGKHVGEYIGNLMGTHWEPRKNYPPPPPFSTLQ